MSDIKDLTEQFLAFREVRDWKQFHNPKDLAISLALEAAEVLEHFQWKSSEEIQTYIVEHKEDIADELADVLSWILFLSHDLQIDIAEATRKKIAKNNAKYPVDKAKGSHSKYTEING